MTSGREPHTYRHKLLVTRTGAKSIYKIRDFTTTDSAITPYTHTHTPWHRRYFLNREVSDSINSITGSVFLGFMLILLKRHIHVKRYKNVSMQDGCIDSRRAFVILYGEGRLCLLPSDWVITLLVRETRFEYRTSSN